jgi:hypothetical protein
MSTDGFKRKKDKDIMSDFESALTFYKEGEDGEKMDPKKRLNKIFKGTIPMMKFKQLIGNKDESEDRSVNMKSLMRSRSNKEDALNTLAKSKTFK